MSNRKSALIKIGNNYFTTNGLPTGETFKNTIENKEVLLSPVAVRHEITSGHGMYSQYNNIGHVGKEITIVIPSCDCSLARAIISDLKTALASKTTINVSIQLDDPDVINYSGTAKPQSPPATCDEITTKVYTNFRVPLILAS